MVSNHGSLDSEATALPTMSQPQLNELSFYGQKGFNFLLFYLFHSGLLALTYFWLIASLLLWWLIRHFLIRGTLLEKGVNCLPDNFVIKHKASLFVEQYFYVYFIQRLSFLLKGEVIWQSGKSFYQRAPWLIHWMGLRTGLVVSKWTKNHLLNFLFLQCLANVRYETVIWRRTTTEDNNSSENEWERKWLMGEQVL